MRLRAVAYGWLGWAGFMTASVLGAAANAGATLPLGRVRLYEAGVAYFERTGVLNRTGQLPVPRSHLDDALKTLVVLDEDGKSSVLGVELEQPLTRARSQALAGLPSGAGGAVSFDAYLQSLAGNSVELTFVSARSVRGRLVNVLSPELSGVSRCAAAPTAERTPQCARVPESAVLIITERGEIERHATSTLSGVRPLDAALAQRLRDAAATRPSDEHRAALSVRLRAGASVTLGYVAEAPLWRSSYRLLLSERGATLQGWALIHNDTEEAWHGVALELVNGQPDSFLFPFAAPRYAERRLVTPERHLPSVPQLLGRTADDAWDSGGGDGEGVRLGSFSTVGHGSAMGAIGVAQSGADESSLLRIGDLAAQAESEGQLTGALFRYKLSQGVDLGARKSLLVPFLREGVSAERVTFFDDVDGAGKSSILMTNSSAQTLPPGTIALFEGGGFAGESAIERWQPQVARFVHFGRDLDVALEAKPSEEREQLRLLRFVDGQLQEHYVRRRQRVCHLTNRANAARKAYLTLPVINNARVSGADAVFVDADAKSVSAVFNLPAAARKAYTVATEEALERELELPRLDAKRVRQWLSQSTLVAQQRPILERVLKSLERQEALLAQQVALGGRIRRLDERLARLTSTLDVVRRADEAQAERQAKLLVDGEAERARLKVALDALAPQSARADAERELRGLVP